MTVLDGDVWIAEGELRWRLVLPVPEGPCGMLSFAGIACSEEEKKIY